MKNTNCTCLNATYKGNALIKLNLKNEKKNIKHYYVRLKTGASVKSYGEDSTFFLIFISTIRTDTTMENMIQELGRTYPNATYKGSTIGVFYDLSVTSTYRHYRYCTN